MGRGDARRRAALETRLGPRSAQVFANYCEHFLIRNPYTGSGSLLEYLYRMLVQLFNMQADDYKRFLSFLRKHDCHLPFQRFRAAPLHVPARPQSAAEAIRRGA